MWLQCATLGCGFHDVEFEYQLYRLWRRIAEWSTSPDETFTETAYQRILQLNKIRSHQIEHYWNADLQYRKRNVMFGLTILLITSIWVGSFGYIKPSFTAITSACSLLGLFFSSVVLYGVWEYFEKGIRALKQELYLDLSDKSEEHLDFVNGLGKLIKARESEGVFLDGPSKPITSSSAPNSSPKKTVTVDK